MASFHLDHLKNYHRRFCRPSRAPNIHTKEGQNMLEILQDCFEDQSKTSFLDDFTESLTSSTQKKTANYSQSSSKKCPASHSKPVQVSSRTGEASLQASAEPSEAAGGSVQAKEVHHGVSDELDLSVGSPVVHLDANVVVLQKAISSAGQKRVASVSRSPVDEQASNTNISFKTRKRLNFEDKVILSTAETENSVLQVEDNLSEGQEGTLSEITQKRDDLSSEVQSRAKKNFSELFLETVKRKVNPVLPYSIPRILTSLHIKFLFNTLYT
uniref:Kinetochore assembly subunit CENP-C N-terminal domain-containing protein n=1 Tax=Mus spicilegus TaxID=10103 RepID=A0A8C6MZC1_MUSSI